LAYIKHKDSLINLADHRNKSLLETTKYLVVQNKAGPDIAKNIAKQDWILHDHAGILHDHAGIMIL